MTYTATYSPDDNKLRLYASARLDSETYARVRAAGFIWAPKQDLFVAPMWTPEREDLAVELAGELDDDDQTLTDRAEDRSERFDGYADNRKRDAESAQAAVARLADGIPLGQPILVGHHSERHARRDAERIDSGMRRALKNWKTSQYWIRRAAGAIRHAKYKERADVRARRIKTIEADDRRVERSAATAAREIRLWGQLNRPHRDGRPCDDELRTARARAILNVGGSYGLWGQFDRGELTPRQVQIECLKVNARALERCRRWREHYANRLTYERAMLEAQGGSALLAPKPRPEQLPLCNYRAPEGIAVESPYHALARNEANTYPQIEMTKAEYAAINQDYKCTRIAGHSHRVRVAMRRAPGSVLSLSCVFLTDAKIHARPDDLPPPPPRRRTWPSPVSEAVERGQRTAPPSAPDPARAAIDTLQTALAAGVQAVSAPTLFPTPPEVARQLLELAEVQPDHRILEPSAGTGRLIASLRAELPTAEIVAVEIRPNLADMLRTTYRVPTYCQDFLTLHGTLGTFDRIVMNPPFTNGEDIKHIQHARGMLAPGGRLVAVCANGPRQRAALEPIADAWIDLPDGSFAGQGTQVRTAIVVISGGAA